MTTIAPETLTGQPVISWSTDTLYRYAGIGERSGMSRVTFRIGSGGLSDLECDFGRVAPADTVIPAKDERVVVVKSTTAEARNAGVPYPDGPWRLDLPGVRATWHKTKRDATAAGLRRMAILDWHAAQDTSITTDHVQPSDRVVDTRTSTPATVVDTHYIGRRGSDGYGIVVEYDDEPGVPVSTGTDYFTRATS